jgi:predicted restriction endonuclease
MSGWTGEKLLTRVRKVSVWKKGDQRAPHKPLLILYALGKLLEGQDEIQFKDLYEPFRDLLQEFAPPRKVYHPEFPFWFLRSEEFWEVEPATARVGLIYIRLSAQAGGRRHGSFGEVIFEPSGQIAAGARVRAGK